MFTPTEGKKSRRKRALFIVAALVLLVALFGRGTIKEGLAWLNGMQTYVYAFPMMVMDKTREVWTAVPEAGQFYAPPNQFAVMTHYPGVSFRAVPRTGLDTLFATAWADLNEEPLVLHVPETNGRYYVIALFDMWSNVFASIGKRTTGTDAADFLLAGPDWQGETPENIKQVFHSPSRYVWVNGQMRADGPQDYAVVNALQKQYQLTPLSHWEKGLSAPAPVAVKSTVDTKTAVLEQIKNMDAAEFFGHFAELLKQNPPAAEDTKILKKMRKIGIVPGQSLDFSTLDPSTAKGLQRAMSTYALLEKGVKKLKTKDGWILMPEDMANYGTDYTTRAGIALIGLGAILPQDVSYPTAFNDEHNKTLDGSNLYLLHFDKDKLPPTLELWSVSAYDVDGYYIPNKINRYHLSSWMPLSYNPDGSLDIYLQPESPGADKEANWLPTPASAPFSLTIRNFWPKKSAIDGTWNAPGVHKVQ